MVSINRPTEPAQDPAKATISQTTEALNSVASKSGFRCVPVSWEDAQRGTVGGALSCWGGNISDVRLWEKSGTLLYTLRSNNWNERLGYVASKDVAVVVGNHARGGEAPAPITLQRYLKGFKQYAGYAGATSEQLWDETADQLLSIRFQAVFLPIKATEVTEFCTEVYNYNTRSDDDPRNTILLCTAQGTSVQQDGQGAKKVFLHTVDGSGSVHRHWLEAERSEHKVGGAQQETDEEAAAAAARGKATAIHIGTKAMGTRFNVQMLIQLPCKQKQRPPQRHYFQQQSQQTGGFFSGFLFGGSAMKKTAPTSCAGPCLGSAMTCEETMCLSSNVDDCLTVCSAPLAPAGPPLCTSAMAKEDGAPFLACRRSGSSVVAKPAPTLGASNAARVSRGTEQDVWAGINNKAPERDPSQHGTITVTLYYTVAGGVPSPADVEACVADLDAMYKACPSDKKLVDCGEVTKELTVKDTIDIKGKLTAQPYVPPTFAPTKSTFPVDD